jgi:hypothetical protein
MITAEFGTGEDTMAGKWNGVGVVFFFIIISTLAGCTQPYYGYSGPRLPETETALLMSDVGVKIYSINGHVVNIKHESEAGLIETTRAILRPGTYNLILVPQHITSVKTFTELQAMLAANRQYRARIRQNIGGSAKGREYEIWVENIASGRRVSNIGTSVNPFRE